VTQATVAEHDIGSSASSTTATMAPTTKAIPPKEMPVSTRSKAFPPKPKYAAKPAVVKVEDVEVENMEATSVVEAENVKVKNVNVENNVKVKNVQVENATTSVKAEESDTNDDEPVFSKWYGVVDVQQATR
jgi:hypothetical protein